MKLTTIFSFCTMLVVATVARGDGDQSLPRRILRHKKKYAMDGLSSSSKGKGSKKSKGKGSKGSKIETTAPTEERCYFIKVGEKTFSLTPLQGTLTPYKQVYENIYPPPGEPQNDLNNLPDWILPDAVSSMLLYEFQGHTYWINANRFPEGPPTGPGSPRINARGQLVLSGDGFDASTIELVPFESRGNGNLGVPDPQGPFAQIDFADTTVRPQTDRLVRPELFDNKTLIHFQSFSSNSPRSLDTIGVKLTLEEDAMGKHEACMSIVQALPQVFYSPADEPSVPTPNDGYVYKWIVQDSSSPIPSIEFDSLKYGIVEDFSFNNRISDIFGRQYFVSSLCFGVCPE